MSPAAPSFSQFIQKYDRKKISFIRVKKRAEREGEGRPLFVLCVLVMNTRFFDVSYKTKFYLTLPPFVNNRFGNNFY